MSYLLDTDILSNLLKRAPSTTLVAKLATIPMRQQHTSSITLGELLYGATRSETRSAALLAQIERRLLPNLTIVAFDALAARHYASVRVALERQGTPIAEADLRIAAIGLARGFVVVTGNTRHFGRVPGLAVENWLV